MCVDLINPIAKKKIGGGSGSASDRVRLLLVYYLCAVERQAPTSIVAQEFEKLEAQLKSDGVDLRPLQYVRAARAHLNALALPTANAGDDDNGIVVFLQLCTNTFRHRF
jgi:hypothetical protein